MTSQSRNQVCNGPLGVVVIETREYQPNQFTFHIKVNGVEEFSLTMNGDFQTCIKVVKLRLVSENYIY